MEITDDNEPPENNDSEFLGFDVAQDYFVSALSNGLHFEKVIKNIPKEDKFLVPLFLLTQEHFKPKLNENGLFNYFEEASFFQEVINAYRILRPGLIEGGESIFKVEGLWLI